MILFYFLFYLMFLSSSKIFKSNPRSRRAKKLNWDTLHLKYTINSIFSGNISQLNLPRCRWGLVLRGGWDRNGRPYDGWSRRRCHYGRRHYRLPHRLAHADRRWRPHHGCRTGCHGRHHARSHGGRTDNLRRRRGLNLNLTGRGHRARRLLARRPHSEDLVLPCFRFDEKMIWFTRGYTLSDLEALQGGQG